MAIPERTAWTDERLNDWAAQVMMLMGLVPRMSKLTEQVEGMRRDVDGLGGRFDKFEERLDSTLQALGTEQAEHRGAERATERATEKQAGRSQGWHTRVIGWLQTAALVAAVVIAVVSLFLSAGSHP